MQLRLETQQNPVADEVAALTAVVRPILEATLFAIKQEAIQDAGGYHNIRLRQLPRLYRGGDGDCGICFEYAVHDAIQRKDASVLTRVFTAVRQCNVNGHSLKSILFGAEKTGVMQLIETAEEILTDDSALLAGTRGRPTKLKRHLKQVASAFKRPEVRLALPYSISGLWKADLFVGCDDSDRWIGTTVKINRLHLEAARGLRIGIVPTSQGRSDSITLDEKRNLVVCPLPHDGDFMEIFYRGWGTVQQFIAADARLPKEVALPLPVERQVARYLADRRDYPILDVIEALIPLSQRGLLVPQNKQAKLVLQGEEQSQTGAVLTPMSRRIG